MIEDVKQYMRGYYSLFGLSMDDAGVVTNESGERVASVNLETIRMEGETFHVDVTVATKVNHLKLDITL